MVNKLDRCYVHCFSVWSAVHKRLCNSRSGILWLAMFQRLLARGFHCRHRRQLHVPTYVAPAPPTAPVWLQIAHIWNKHCRNNKRNNYVSSKHSSFHFYYYYYYYYTNMLTWSHIICSNELRRLPVRRRVYFKLAILMLKLLHGQARTGELRSSGTWGGVTVRQDYAMMMMMAKHRSIYLRNAKWCHMSVADYGPPTH